MIEEQHGSQPVGEIAVRVDNEYGLTTGENLPNHTSAMRGRGKFVMASTYPRPVLVRTKQEAYRFMAHLERLITDLPDEDGEHTYQEVKEAVLKLHS